MSKIIEALEKAKREGHVDALVEPIDERGTLGAVGAHPLPRTAAVAELHPASSRAWTSGTPRRELSPELLTGLDPHLAPLHQPMSAVSEQYRSLRNRIERETAAGGAQVLAVTSSVKGEGKSLSATNLSLVLAQDVSKRVLLVDADLRRPMIHDLLHLARTPGLSELLEGGGAAPVQETQFFGLCVVTAGEAQGHPSELLAGAALREFLNEQRREFAHIIIDTPPLNPISDVSSLSEAVDGFILVVRARKTDKSLIKRSVATLPGGKVMGTLLNRAEGAQGGYGTGKDGYYSGYY